MPWRSARTWRPSMRTTPMWKNVMSATAHRSASRAGRCASDPAPGSDSVGARPPAAAVRGRPLVAPGRARRARRSRRGTAIQLAAGARPTNTSESSARWNRMPSPITWPSGLHGTNCLARSTGKWAKLFDRQPASSASASGPSTYCSTMWCDWSNSARALAPRALLVAPVGELGGHDGVHVRPDLRVAQQVDRIPDRAQQILETATHPSPRRRRRERLGARSRTRTQKLYDTVTP